MLGYLFWRVYYWSALSLYLKNDFIFIYTINPSHINNNEHNLPIYLRHFSIDGRNALHERIFIDVRNVP